MSKKFFFIILFFHLIVPTSVFFPVLKISSTSTDISLCNIFQYVKDNPSVYATVLLLVFLLIEIVGVGNAVYGLVKKENVKRNKQSSFLLGFSSAILGAMFISVGSRVFFFLCAVSFIAISYASIKLMKLEE